MAEQDAPSWLAESLARSDAEIAASQTVPIEPVLERLRVSIARMQAKRELAQRQSA